jgi:hypothetical protein
VPQLVRWSLALTTARPLGVSDQCPARPATPRQQRLIVHDLRTTEAIVRLIEIGRRSKLSGIYVAHELRLNPEEKRPICDALVVVQFGTFDQPNLVPWSSDPVIEDEGQLRFAIEADNDTEPLGVIAGKARAYRRLDEDDAWAAWWMRQHGPLPIPLWVAPSEARATTIHNQWKRAWPDGKWIITTDAGFQRNELLKWEQHKEKQIALGFTRRQPQLPTPPTQPPAQPQQVVVPASPAPQQRAPAAPLPSVAPSQPATVSGSTSATMQAPAASPQPAPPRSSAPDAVTAQPLPPLPTVADYEAGRKLYSRRKPWLDISWKLLCWFGSLLWTMLRLPWRVLVAIARWCSHLDEETFFVAWRVSLAIALVAVPLYIWLAQPAWLLDPLHAALPPVGVVTEAAPPAAPLPDTTLPASGCPTARVTARQVNLRAGPGREEMILRKLRLGELLTVRDCRGHEEDGYTWWQIVGEDGVEGWAATNWLEVAK